MWRPSVDVSNGVGTNGTKRNGLMAENGGLRTSPTGCVWAPGRPGRVERLSRELRAILAEPETRARLAEQGADPAPTTHDTFAQRIRDDLAKWAGVVRAAGIQPD